MNNKVISWINLQKEFGEDLILTKNESLLIHSLQTSESVKPQESQNLSAPLSSFSSPKHSTKPQDLSASAAFIPQKTTGPQFATAHSLEDLKQKILAFEDCALKAMATNTVFSDGNPKSEVMFIGEAPGAEEDKQGIPFVGQSGQLLNKMLASIGLDRGKVYITNVINWRPPGNRPPTPEEIQQCLPFLRQHIRLISPRIIVLLGATAMKAVLQINTSLSRARGIWHSYQPMVDQKNIDTLVTFHPSYLLRSPGQKALAWQDFMTLQDALNHV